MCMKKTILMALFLCMAGSMISYADVIAVHEDDFEDRNIGDPTEGWHWFDNSASHVGTYVDFEGSIVQEHAGTLREDINQRFGYKTDIEMTGNTSDDPCDYTLELDIRNLQGNWDPHIIEIWILTYNPDTGGGTYGYGLPVLDLYQADEWVHVTANLGDLVELGRTWWEGTGWDMTNPTWSYEIGGPGWPGVEVVGDPWTQIFLVDNLKISMFAEPPEFAREPVPEDQSTDILRDVVLSWTPGDFADKRDVYFGTNADDVNEASRDNPLGVLVSQDQQETTYDPPGLLDYNQTYYWRVDELNDTEPNSPWRGKVWSFTTVNYIVVEDFEDYNDYSPNEVWNTWIDGYGDPTNGATAGYPDPDFNADEHYLEGDIVNSGDWSLPLFYDNTAGLSEVVRTWDTPMDWTKAEDELLVLVLYFEGDPANSAQPLYIAVEDSSGTIKVITHENPNAAQLNGWQDWNILLTDLTDAGVNLGAVKKIYIGMGNRDNPQAGGGSGHVFIDDIRVYRRRCVPSMAKPEYDLNNDCIVDQADLDLLMTEHGRSSVNPADIGVFREAESADILRSPMEISNDATASGGQYIGTDPGAGDSTTNPPTNSLASYNFTVAGGVYKVMLQVSISGGNDSFWVRIPGATNLTPGEDPVNANTGWVRFNGIQTGAEWHWDEVHSADHNDEVSNWTLPAGNYTLEIKHREAGALLDSILITDDLDFDAAVLEPLMYDLNGDGTVDDADVALLMEQWLDEVLWP